MKHEQGYRCFYAGNCWGKPDNQAASGNGKKGRTLTLETIFAGRAFQSIKKLLQ
jgi:hypothetical protein